MLMKRLSSTVITDYQKPIKTKQFSPSPIKRYSQKHQISSDNKENIGSCSRNLFQSKFKRPLALSKKKLQDQNNLQNDHLNQDQSFIIPLKTSSIQNVVRFENSSSASAQIQQIPEGSSQIILKINSTSNKNEQLKSDKDIEKKRRDQKMESKFNEMIKKLKRASNFEEEKLKINLNLEKQDTNIIQNFNLENQELSSTDKNDIQNQFNKINNIQFTTEMSKDDFINTTQTQQFNCNPSLQQYSTPLTPNFIQNIQSGQDLQSKMIPYSQPFSQENENQQQSQQQSMLMNGVQFQGRWTSEEHIKFIEGLNLFGKDWRKIEEHIGSRTCAQIRSHAQKYFNRVTKEVSKDYVMGQDDESKEQSENIMMDSQSVTSNTIQNVQMQQHQKSSQIMTSPKQKYVKEQEQVMIQTNKQLMQIEERFSKIEEEDLQIKLNNLLLEREMISKFLIKKRILAQEACEKLIEVTQKLHQLGLHSYMNNKLDICKRLIDERNITQFICILLAQRVILVQSSDIVNAFDIKSISQEENNQNLNNHKSCFEEEKDQFEEMKDNNKMTEKKHNDQAKNVVVQRYSINNGLYFM